jgi:hypothetical protein
MSKGMRGGCSTPTSGAIPVLLMAGSFACYGKPAAFLNGLSRRRRR